MGIEWEETVETKRRVALVVDLKPSEPFDAPDEVRAATIDDLRRACEAVGLVAETREAMDNWASAVHDAERYRLACLDALSEHVSPDATADTPRMIRPSSVLAGIRSLQARLRDARSDLREHDAALEAAVERRSEEADASTEQARAILNAVPGEDIVSAARRTMASLARSVEKGEALRYDLSTIVDEAFGMQPVMTHEELLSFLEDKVKERGRDLTAARDRIAELEAPLPEATVEELGKLAHDTDQPGAAEIHWQSNDARRHRYCDMARAVAERVRRERPPCLIARAVAGGVELEVLGFGAAGAWTVRVKGTHKRNVPAAEVPAELARMLTEVGA